MLSQPGEDREGSLVAGDPDKIRVNGLIKQVLNNGVEQCVWGESVDGKSMRCV